MPKFVAPTSLLICLALASYTIIAAARRLHKETNSHHRQRTIHLPTTVALILALLVLGGSLVGIARLHPSAASETAVGIVVICVGLYLLYITSDRTQDDPTQRGATHRWHAPAKWGLSIGLVAAIIGLLALLGVLSTTRIGKPSRAQQGASWGPRRPTFSMESPATYVTFNSITDNPFAGGDERQFLDVHARGSGQVSHRLRVRNNEAVVVRAYFENDSAANLHLTALHTHMGLKLPSDAATAQTVQAYIAASGARPPRVWDSVQLMATHRFHLIYVHSSARLWNNATTLPLWGSSLKGGIPLSNGIVTPQGALLGCNRMLNGEVSGDIKGCSGWVTAILRVQYV